MGTVAPANIRLFSTDLDGTLLGNPAAVQRFAHTWHSIPRGRRPLLVYNTGRTVADTRTLVATRQLPEADYIIGSVGTELHDSLYTCGEHFRAQFTANWNLDAVERVMSEITTARRQPAEFHHPFKSSWYWVRARREEIAEIESRLRDAGIDASVVYSCRYFLDIIPRCAGKGAALRWLCERLHVPLRNVLVAGDTANDSSMFLLPAVKGIVVENALPELLAEVVRREIFVSHSSMADGVLEGLLHYRVIDALPAFDGQPFKQLSHT